MLVYSLMIFKCKFILKETIEYRVKSNNRIQSQEVKDYKLRNFVHLLIHCGHTSKP